MSQAPEIYCADVGSIAQGNFGWARSGEAIAAEHETRIDKLVDHVVADLEAGKKVALGFECPLFIPVPEEPSRLGKARAGEGSRSWSAGAGTGALATGLSQAAWVLNEVRRSRPATRPSLAWPQFRSGESDLLVWEAFVSGVAKSPIEGNPHAADAALAVREFLRRLPDPSQHSNVEATRPLSLVGTALLWSGLTNDVELVREPCLVVKVD